MNTDKKNPDCLIDFSDRRHRVFQMLLLLILVGGTLLKLNGWSLPLWHDFIDQSPQSEVLFGTTYEIRSDDYSLNIPLMLAQIAHEPRFPLVNRNIAGGHLMNLPQPVPTTGITAIFRPFSWGLAISPDIGLAFRWWSLQTGLLYATFLLLMIVSRNQFAASLLLSLGIVYAPFFQFWSFQIVELTIYALLTLITGCYFLSARESGAALFRGLLLGYCFSGTVLSNINPAILVPVCWFILFSWAAFFLDRRGELALRDIRPARITGLLLAAAVVAASAAAFYRESADVVQLISNTVYPGKRFTTGGDYPLWAFFSYNLGAVAAFKKGLWLPNICESGSFIFGFVPVILIMLFSWTTRRKIANPWLIVMLGYMLFVCGYAYIGFPDWLAAATFMGKSLPNRVQTGLGLANAVVLAAFCANYRELFRARTATAATAIAVWGAILFGFMFWFKGQYPPLRLDIAVSCILLNLLAAYVAIIREKPLVLPIFLLLFSFCTSIMFNPVVVGGTEFLYKNELSRKIRQISDHDPSHSPWVVMGDNNISNLPRILGVPSLGGYQGYPHLEMWKIFDPEGRWGSIYNQSAYVDFRAAQTSGIRFLGVGDGYFRVYANPDHPAFKTLGVKYFLSCNEKSHAAFRKSGTFKEADRFRNFVLFERQETGTIPAGSGPP